jgi:C-terminal processing protease CtpA/Prc
MNILQEVDKNLKTLLTTFLICFFLPSITKTIELKKYKHILSKKNNSKIGKSNISLLNNKEKINSKKDIYPWLGTVAEVISLIEQKAFRNVDFGSFIQEALKSAVPHVDAHSAFFSKRSYQEAMESTSGFSCDCKNCRE